MEDFKQPWLRKMTGSSEGSLKKLKWSLFAILGVLATLITIFTVSKLIMHGNTGIYNGHSILIPIPNGNSGPRIREQITPENITSWAPDQLSMADFTIRLDDQTLIPKTVFTDYEVHIREWFIEHWPALEAVYHSGLYLDANFLTSGADANGIPMGERFHIAHCVIHMRRAYKAQMDGTHVSPRDLDMGHADHCLSVLEEFALRDDRWCVEGPWLLKWETWVAW